MVVPQLEAAPAVASGQVVRPPRGAAPRLSAGVTQVARSVTPTGMRQTAYQRPVVKKKNPLAKLALIGGALIVLAGGGYFAADHFGLLGGAQDESLAKPATVRKKSDAGQVGGPMGEVNATLDVAETLQGGSSAPGPGARRPRPAAPAAEGTAASGTAATPAPDKALPVVAPVYTLDVTQAKIPDSKVNGVIAGTNFVSDSARLDKGLGYYALTLRQGAGLSPDRAILVYLHLKPTEGPTNQTFTVSPEARDAAVSQVVKLWKTNPRYAPTQQRFSANYALKLELGQMNDGVIPGKIFLALPDSDKTVVAGQFKAMLVIPEPGTQVVPVTPVPGPTASPANAAAAAQFRQRYGRPR